MAKRKTDHSRPKTMCESAPWKNIVGFSRKMLDLTNKMKEELRTTGRMTLPHCDYDGRSVPVMEGNSKTGALRSLSLRPILDCGNCKCCMGQCYDLRHDVTNSACLEYRCATAAIYDVDRERFWREVEAQMTISTLWRWHIGGDILDMDYFIHMVECAKKNPRCHQLAFTKMYDIVNVYIDECGELPSNMHIIFSMWPGLDMDNRHGLPVSFPVFADVDVRNNEQIAEFAERCPKFYWKCNDNCTECALKEQGCFRLEKGESVGFNYH